ncbi:MAG: MATE family efflux transporter [Lachnospiraceae bacterium]|jgi:putative MATE family efflux protein|nr:MATE family efflux transporter [Lachnospiraceae bacterium]
MNGQISNNDESKNPLGSASIGKLIPKFAIPAMISMLVASTYNIVDQIFIGQGVGLLGNAATNIAFPIAIFCTAMALLLGIGGASNYNLESGRGNTEKAAKIAGTALSMLLICSCTYAVLVLIFLRPLLQIFGVTAEILPYALDYTGITAFGIPFLVVTTGGNHLIRADRSPTYSMISIVSGAIINTILDPLFIFGFGWGIKGAAIATVIGQVFSGLMVAFYFIKMKKMNLTLHRLKPVGSYIKAILSLGLAAFVNQIAFALVQIAMNNTLRHYGADSIYGTEIPLACAGVISKVTAIFMSFCIGLSQGCQPIYGFNYGAKKYDRVEKAWKTAMISALGFGTFFGLAFQIFPRQIVSIFGSGDEVYYHFAERYFRIFLMMTFINGIQPLSSGFFTSIGKAKRGIIISLTRQVIFLTPLILIFPIFMGIDGFMYAGPIADFASAATALGLGVREIRSMRRLT